MIKPLKKAIFPVAGLGTRFLPATKSMPKEMLTVVDKPLIQYAVEEAQAAGIEEMIFVTGRGKSAMEDHFDHSYELEDTLQRRGKKAELELLPMQAGDVPATEADTGALDAAVGFKPGTPVEVGIQRFADWYREYFRIPK